jgi:shikimate kinase
MQVLYQRLAYSKNRPLLNTEGSETINERLDRLKKDRLPFYELANLRITEESISVERLIQLIP